MPQLRYGKLIDLVIEVKPRTIIEIGVWNGTRAMEMGKAALNHRHRVHYTGYDLFEDANIETDAEEFNAKKNWSVEKVASRLREFKENNKGFKFKLIKGNTKETLVSGKHTADFAYIDGGHSVETILNDYEAVIGSKMIVFDDYYLPNDEGECPDTKIYGANIIVDIIEGAEIINTQDKVVGGGYVCLAVVRN